MSDNFAILMEASMLDLNIFPDNLILILSSVAIVAYGVIILLIVSGFLLVRKKRKVLGIALLSIGLLSGMSFTFVVTLGGAFLLFVGEMQKGMDVKSENFNPANYSGKLGSIAFPYQGESELTSEIKKSKRMIFKSSDGLFKVPAGSNSFSRYSIHAADAKGTNWAANMYDVKELKKSLNVPENSVLKINAGPPFKTKIEVKEKPGGNVSMSLDIRDIAGNKASIYCMGPADVNHGFEVYSSGGEKLWSGDFEYG